MNRIVVHGTPYNEADIRCIRRESKGLSFFEDIDFFPSFLLSFILSFFLSFFSSFDSRKIGRVVVLIYSFFYVMFRAFSGILERGDLTNLHIFVKREDSQSRRAILILLTFKCFRLFEYIVLLSFGGIILENYVILQVILIPPINYFI